MLAALIPYAFAAAGAFALAVIYSSLRDAMRKAPLLARQIAQFQTMQIRWHIRQIGE